MRRSNIFAASLAASSAIALTLGATPSAAQRVEIGNASTVVGSVNMSNAQITRPRAIARRQRIAWGDLIETGRRSQLQILLLDRSSFGMGARSSVRIDRFVYNPNEGRALFATAVRGALRFLSGRQEGTNSAEIQTPAGRIGIRGTALDLLVGGEAEDIAEDERFVGNVRSDEDEATLVIMRGPGPGTAGGLTPGLAEVEAAGVTVVLDRQGLAAYIPRNGAPPIGPFQISDRALSRVQDQLAPEVARASRSGGGLLEALIPLAVGAIAVGVLLNGDDDDDDTRQTPNGQTEDCGLRPCNIGREGDAEVPPDPETDRRPDSPND